MLAMGTVQAQTSTTCSWVASSTPAQVLHCGVYGRLNPSLTDVRHVVSTPDITDCTNGCLDADDCVAFGYNTTTSACTMYGHNLIQMGLKQQVTGDTLFSNHKCFVQRCGPVTSSASASTTSPLMTSSSMTTSSLAEMSTQDSCFSALNHHPKVASSVCGNIDSQTAAPRGFKKDCNGDWTSRLSSVCSSFSASNTRFTPVAADASTSSSSTQSSDVVTSTMPVPQTSSSPASAITTLNTTSSEMTLSSSTVITSSSTVPISSSQAANAATSEAITSSSTTSDISAVSVSVPTSSGPMAVNTSSTITSAFYANSTISTSTVPESTSLAASSNTTTVTAVSTTSTTSPTFQNTTSVIPSSSTSITVSDSTTTAANSTFVASSTSTQAPALIANSTWIAQNTTSSTILPAAANTTSVMFSNSTSSMASTTMQNVTSSATASVLTNTTTVMTSSMPLSTAVSSTVSNSSVPASYTNTTSSAMVTAMPLSTAASSSLTNSSISVLYANISTSTSCLGCTTSTIVAATTANTISPSALPAASVTTSSSIASAVGAASAAPAAPSFVGPSFYAQIVGDDSNQNGNFLVLQSSQQGADTQVDTAFTSDIDSASSFELDSLGHLKIAGNNDQEAFNFFYDTETAVSEDYLVWDDPYDVATKDRSKPMYCSITSAGELQCVNTHENNEVFTTFFTCTQFSFLGMGIGPSALPADDNCAIVTINVAQSTSSASSTTATSPFATPPPPTCSGAITSTFYLLANSSATNSSNMNNNQYLVSTLGGGYGYNTGGETYFTDDLNYATPFTILSSGDLVMAEACNQDGYWDTYGEVLGFNIPGAGDKEFYTGHPATFYVSADGTLESDINTEGGYYEQNGAFWVCEASPKLRFDWDQAYEDYGKSGHEQGCDRAVLEVVYAQGGGASSAQVD